MNTIQLENHPIRMQDGFVSLTDMAKAYAGGDNQLASNAIRNWLKASKTLNFLIELETQTNEDFNMAQLGHIRTEAARGKLTLFRKRKIVVL